jgi:hypothetical protein
MKLFSSFVGVGILGFLIAIFTAQHGCAGNCAANCPATTVYIGSPDDTELSIAFDVNGPACPNGENVVCTGDESQTYCTHTTVTGQAASWCDVLVAFDPYTDGRPWQIIHLEFGQTNNTNGSCCAGYPVIGPATYIIPDHPQSGGVYGTNADGSARDYDAISTLHDASAADAADGGTDG